MRLSSLERLTAALGILSAVLVVGSGFLFCRFGQLQTQAAFADEQTKLLDDMRVQALQSASPPDIAASLEYAISYYPSGSKQTAGSSLDRVVERHRTAVVRDIVAHLRRTTGQDLGESPAPWIQKYVQMAGRDDGPPSSAPQ